MTHTYLYMHEAGARARLLERLAILRESETSDSCLVLEHGNGNVGATLIPVRGRILGLCTSATAVAVAAVAGVRVACFSGSMSVSARASFCTQRAACLYLVYVNAAVYLV